MMYSGSPMYQFLLLPLVCLGGFGIMLCFVGLLPGVGNWLVAVFGATLGDGMMQKRKGGSVWAEEE
jgi:hypothetical protein